MHYIYTKYLKKVIRNDIMTGIDNCIVNVK